MSRGGIAIDYFDRLTVTQSSLHNDMIMSHPSELQNRVRALRLGRGWSQAELAARAGISRAAVSAIEIERLVPSVVAALSLATALECRVDDLFGFGGRDETPRWAWDPPSERCRYWEAVVAGRRLLYPAESTALGVIGHDGMYDHGSFQARRENLPEQTLVMACCDPAATLLAMELARRTPYRLVVLPRSSGEALRLLGEKLVHVAGVHLAKAGARRGNAEAVRKKLGTGYNLLHVARWQEGLAISPGAGVSTVRQALKKDLRWVGREPGSGARQCLDELLENRDPPRRIARDHRGVAEAIQCGWADIGVCVKLVSEEAGLKFLSLRDETYDLCFSTDAESDPRVKALIETVRSEEYRSLLGELPGYEIMKSGEVERV